MLCLLIVYMFSFLLSHGKKSCPSGKQVILMMSIGWSEIIIFDMLIAGMGIEVCFILYCEDQNVDPL